MNRPKRLTPLASPTTIRIKNGRGAPWSAAELRQLGKVPDAELARRLGRSEVTVIIRRRALGIPKKNSMMRPYTREEDRLLGTMPDEELACRLRRTPAAIQVRRVAFGIAKFRPEPGSRAGKPWGRAWARWTREELALLGKLPDREISRRLSRSVVAIRVQRCKLGIKDPSTCKPWTRADVKLVGTASDSDIARRIGRSAGAVQKRRVGLGIAAWKPQSP